MTALVAVASYLPGKPIPLEDAAAPFGFTEMQIKVFRRYLKLAEIRRDPHGSLADLLRGALTNLTALRGREHRVRYVLYARAFPVVVPYPLNPLHEVCREYGLGHAQAFTVTHQACATGLQTIDLAGRLLAGDADRGGDPDALALVIAGEKAFTGEAAHIPETSFFGEGAGACLVSVDGDHDRMLSYRTWLRGEFDGDLEDVAGEFQRAYPESLAEVVTAAVARAGLSLEDIGLILPHNVNRIAWQRVCKIIRFPLDRVLLDHVSTDGHVYCADAFINYRTATERGLLQRGTRYVIAAAGAGRGATFSAMVFEH
ncbi:MAG TPA: 3-oxoacyl-[acyl-carrier-protein] synthase III C-terminal domain-containing protein [Candidatus Limnocylindrales bacterium]|nr:3-oxoacyl-[acyl-carrier-protein] synthase III C-terminal domain-containing protein [Candidatus Limnocylindrales bacterium]